MFKSSGEHIENSFLSVDETDKSNKLEKATVFRNQKLLEDYEFGAKNNITLDLDSVELLSNICQSYADPLIFRSHKASLSAAEKQRIVAPAIVQKTVTVRIGSKMILCTAIGAPILGKAEIKRLGARLGVSRSAAKRISINPADCDPMAEFGMPPGMVSPFLRPGSRVQLDGVAFMGIGDPSAGSASQVAISLSLHWSLLINAGTFCRVLREYAAVAYPWLPLLDFSGSAQEALV